MILRRSALHALKALLELAGEPAAWHPVQRIAAAQGIPGPMLEQILLRLRRGGLVVARRGRSGGYRLARPAAAIPLAAVLVAIGADPSPPLGGGWIDAPIEGRPAQGGDRSPGAAGERVALALERRLRRALERELAALSLEDLHHDLRSWQECLRDDGGLMLG